MSFHTSAGDTSTAPCFIGTDIIAAALHRALHAGGPTVRVRVLDLQLSDGDRRELAVRCERIVFGTPGLSDRRGAQGVAPAC